MESPTEAGFQDEVNAVFEPEADLHGRTMFHKPETTEATLY